MSLTGKLEYLWMYYKWVLLIVIAVIFVVVYGINWYRESKIKNILTIAPVNCVLYDTEELTDQIMKTLEADPATQEVTVMTNLTADEKTGDFDYYGQIAYITHIETKSLDIVLMPESTAKILDGQDVLLPLDQLFDQAQYEARKDNIRHNCLVMEDASLAETFMIGYEPVYVGLIANSKNKETALKWILSLP